jgi:hypothetical protein
MVKDQRGVARGEGMEGEALKRAFIALDLITTRIMSSSPSLGSRIFVSDNQSYVQIGLAQICRRGRINCSSYPFMLALCTLD